MFEEYCMFLKIMCQCNISQVNVTYADQVDAYGRWRFIATHLTNYYEGNQEASWFKATGVKRLMLVNT